MTAPLRFELNIEALVLEGVPPAPGLRQAVERELMRLLSEGGALDRWAALSNGSMQLDLAHIDAGLLRGPQSGAALGARLGQAIYKSLTGIPQQQAPETQMQPMQARQEDKR